jgi:hypothetical protein
MGLQMKCLMLLMLTEVMRQRPQQMRQHRSRRGMSSSRKRRVRWKSSSQLSARN